MSDLYLDEETTVGGYLWIAERLSLSGLSLEELDLIFFNEVHPVLCWNLKAVAGHWGVFDKEWVASAIAEYLAKPPANGWCAGIRERRRKTESEDLKEMVECDWQKVRLLIEVIRGRGLRPIT
jgi:hypothetical protein